MKVPEIEKLDWKLDADGFWRAGPIVVWRVRVLWSLHYQDFEGTHAARRGFRTPLSAMRYAERLRSLNAHLFMARHVAGEAARREWEARHGKIVKEQVRIVRKPKAVIVQSIKQKGAAG